MESRMPSCWAVTLVVMLALAMLCNRTTEAYGGPFSGFYSQSCPEAEATIYNILYKHAQEDPAIRADLLRLHFHDAFVRGADASVLLEGREMDRMAPPNFRLEGFSVVDLMKEELKWICPETVSCADIGLLYLQSHSDHHC